MIQWLEENASGPRVKARLVSTPQMAVFRWECKAYLDGRYIGLASLRGGFDFTEQVTSGAHSLKLVSTEDPPWSAIVLFEITKEKDCRVELTKADWSASWAKVEPIYSQ